MVGISTSCLPGVATNLEEFSVIAQRMGFISFEIGISSAVISTREILKWHENTKANIVSVHNLFVDEPLQPENARGDFLASLNEDNRIRTVEYTLKTAGLAKQLGAKAVVLHGGYIDNPQLKDGYKELKEKFYHNIDNAPAKELNELRQKLIKIRTKLASAYVENLIKSLRSLCKVEKEIFFCLEPRVHFYEIPNFEEMKEIFNRVHAKNLGYWHDIGHCQIQETLGFSRQEDWLQIFGQHMVGIHFHDVKKLRDHLPLGMGNIDYSFLSKYLTDDVVRVLEVNNQVTEEELSASMKYLRRLHLL
ncbi:sugar phosphate isomerase/epimerase family protein [Candidatus Auribacterota bacterium]